MLMNRTFFLACATVVTLSVAAGQASTPAQAQPCSEKRTERERQECSIRSAIYTAVSRAEAAAASAQQQQAAAARAKQEQAAAARAQQQQAAAARAQQQQAAAAPVTKPTATSSPPEKSCGLTKEYVNGAVRFRDTCTGEWAQQDTHN
jgi:hypothetical protein